MELLKILGFVIIMFAVVAAVVYGISNIIKYKINKLNDEK